MVQDSKSEKEFNYTIQARIPPKDQIFPEGISVWPVMSVKDNITKPYPVSDHEFKNISEITTRNIVDNFMSNFKRCML